MRVCVRVCARFNYLICDENTVDFKQIPRATMKFLRTRLCAFKCFHFVLLRRRKSRFGIFIVNSTQLTQTVGRESGRITIFGLSIRVPTFGAGKTEKQMTVVSDRSRAAYKFTGKVQKSKFVRNRQNTSVDFTRLFVRSSVLNRDT